MTDTMLDTALYKLKLQQLRQEYASRLQAIEKDLSHQDNPVEKDFEEQAAQLENEPVLEALDDETRDILQQIDTALQCIDQGTYGICKKCGQPISEQRLNAVPYTCLCIKCAS